MDPPAGARLPAGAIRLRPAGAWRRTLLASLPTAWLPACGPADLANVLTPSGGGRRVADLAYGLLPRQRLDLYLPAAEGGAAAPPLVVFFHGGNWQGGSRRDYPFLAWALASRGMAVAVPDYRLHPEARWPDFLEDGALAVAWLRGDAGRAAGAPPGPCFGMGHSAGAYNAAALALDPRWLDAAGLPDGGRGALAGLVALAGPFDWTPRDEPLATIFAAAPRGRLEAAPSDAALAGAPPALLLHGEDDTTVGPFHSTRLAERLRAAGGTPELRLYPGVGHVGIVAAFAAPLRALGLARAPVLEDVAAFVGRVSASA